MELSATFTVFPGILLIICYERATFMTLGPGSVNVILLA